MRLSRMKCPGKLIPEVLQMKNADGVQRSYEVGKPMPRTQLPKGEELPHLPSFHHSLPSSLQRIR